MLIAIYGPNLIMAIQISKDLNLTYGIQGRIAHSIANHLRKGGLH